MNHYRRVLKDLASKILSDGFPEENDNLLFTKPKVSQLFLPFISGDESTVLVDYFGDGGYHFLKRQPCQLDYDVGLNNQTKNYFKNIRRKLRGHLCTHISSLEDKHKPTAYVEIDFNNFVLTRLDVCEQNASGDTCNNPILPSNLQENNSSVFKLVSFNRVQVQCPHSEYQLLESLRRSGASLKKVTYLKDEMFVDTDYGCPVKKEGSTFPFSSIIHLDPVTLAPEEWEYLSWSPSSVLIIPPARLKNMCGLSIKTHVSRRIKLVLNENEVKKNEPYLPYSDFRGWLWRNSAGQLCVRKDSGIKNITVNSRRRSYILQIGKVTFLLDVCQKKVYRVNKDTGSTWLVCCGSCIPRIRFPQIDNYVDTISRLASLISMKVLRESIRPGVLSFVLGEYFLLTHEMTAPVSCKDFQRFRQSKGKELLAQPDNSVSKEEMEEFVAWCNNNLK